MLDNGDFVYLDQALPGVYWDAKYFSRDNFTGRQVDGYEVNRVVGSRALSRALQRAQERARQSNLELLLWDAYRPERAVRFFLNWAAGPEDFQTKERHYPRIALVGPKKNCKQRRNCTLQSGICQNWRV